jgi:hypothetical protein
MHSATASIAVVAATFSLKQGIIWRKRPRDGRENREKPGTMRENRVNFSCREGSLEKEGEPGTRMRAEKTQSNGIYTLPKTALRSVLK